MANALMVRAGYAVTEAACRPRAWRERSRAGAVCDHLPTVTRRGGSAMSHGPGCQNGGGQFVALDFPGDVTGVEPLDLARQDTTLIADITPRKADLAFTPGPLRITNGGAGHGRSQPLYDLRSGFAPKHQYTPSRFSRLQPASLGQVAMAGMVCSLA